MVSYADMVDYADLEIGLHHRSPRTWSVELRYNHPESAVDQILESGDARVRFDLGKLQEQVFDPAAYGRVLSTSLFVPEVMQAFDTARTLAQSDDLPLRVRLRIGPSAPELHGVRWETLRDPKDDSALLMDQSILFSRYLSSLDSRPVVVGSKSELRALVAIANPSDLAEFEGDGRPLPPIDVAGELNRAKRSLGWMPITPLASGGTATLPRVIEALRKGHDILYLVCHGYLIEGESQVLLEDSTGRVHRVPGDEFVDALRTLRRPPRLVVLASCQSAGAGEEVSSDDHGALAALGPRMAETGIPAVLAMQGKVSMQTMEQFVPVFFEELDRDGQIDRAMTLARAAVRHRHDWWVPVLFMRLKTGRFWYRPGFVGGRDIPRLAGLCNEIDQERCTALLGPGLTDAFIGARQDIARGWASQYHFPMAQHYRDDLPHVAQYLTVEQGPNFPRDELNDYIRQELVERYGAFLPDGVGKGSLDALITAVGTYRRSVDEFEPHAVLARLPFKVFITIDQTNLLADALEAEGKEPQVELCRWKDEDIWPESVFDDPFSQYEPSPKRPLVYHLFGHLRDPDTLVLTEDDYFDYLIGVTRNKELIPATVRRAFTDSTLLFLGFRLDEWDFRVLLRSIMSQEGRWRNNRYPHVAAQINPDEGRTIQPDRARQYLESYFSQLGQIKVSIFWGSVEDFVQRLSAFWQEGKR
ncbi:MAG: CHAT domain-containing protein [Egibacteraceae bacterium]